MEYLVTVLIGFFSGAAGSLLAPWVTWGIEKRRDRRAGRKDLIIEAMQYINSESFSAFQFSKETYYIRLKPYFDQNVIDWVEKFDHYFESADDPSILCDDLKVELLKQLQRVEKRWGLI